MIARRFIRHNSPLYVVKITRPAGHPVLNLAKRTISSHESSDFLEHFFQTHTPPSPANDYFASKPWARRILTDPEYEAVPFFSHHFIEQTGENRFFAQVVNTESTIPHLLSFRHRDLKPGIPKSSLTPTDQASDDTKPDVLALLALGQGLEAHPSIVHGGFQCVIFDEIARFLILVHQNANSNPGLRDIHYTLNMTTRYAQPVTTPADVLVKAKLVKREGRKWHTRAEIVSETGQELTSAESLWLTARAKS